MQFFSTDCNCEKNVSEDEMQQKMLEGTKTTMFHTDEMAVRDFFF